MSFTEALKPVSLEESTKEGGGGGSSYTSETIVKPMRDPAPQKLC